MNLIPLLCPAGWLCLAFSFSAPAGAVQDPAVPAVPPAVSQQPAGAVPADPAAGDGSQLLPADRLRAIDFLTNEMVQLTPGRLEGNPGLKAEFDAAATALVDSLPEQAREKLEAAAAANPNLPPVDLLLAAMYFAGGNPPQGQVLLEKTAIEHADYPMVYIAFARLALAQQRRTDARVLLEKALETASAGTWSESQSLHFGNSRLDALADLLFLDEKFPEARQTLTTLLERDPSSSRSHLRLAEVAFREKNTEESLKHLKQYCSMEKDARVPELLLATFFQRGGDNEEAAKWVEAAYVQHPDRIPVLTEYAAFQINLENFTAASRALAKVEELAGTMPVSVLLKGKMAFAQQAYEVAESRFAELNKLDPSNAEVANLWCMALAESSAADKLSLALEKAQQNLQAQPQNGFAATVLGWVYFRQKNYEQANVWFSRAAQTRNLPPEAAYYFARFLQHVGQTDKALELINEALQSKNLFLYRNSAITLKGELTAASQSLNPPNDR